MKDRPQLKITEDGSHTLYSDRFEQPYHNQKGAVTESKHVFFEQNGLKRALVHHDQITILETGFGTGLNLLLLMDLLSAFQSPPKIHYQTVEAYPISGETAKQLNYSDYLHHPGLAAKLPAVFNQLRPGMNRMQLLPCLQLSVFYGLFGDYTPAHPAVDFIFHDAFSPEVNPELWSGNTFKKIFQWSDANAVLSTYCAASKARGAMAWAGWNVARAKGAPGKREMTVASPSEQPLTHLKRINEERLARRYEEDDF